ELALLCPDVVPNEKKKVELYIKGLPEVIKGERTSSRPTMVNDVVHMARTLMEQKIQAKNERIAKSNNKTKCTKFNKIGHKTKDCRMRGVATGVNALPIRSCYEYEDRKHNRSRCPKLADQRGGNATSRAYALRDAEQGQGPNVVTDKYVIDEHNHKFVRVDDNLTANQSLSTHLNLEVNQIDRQSSKADIGS
nr:hypothetical protein [Tanacetum cinerariifolium]